MYILSCINLLCVLFQPVLVVGDSHLRALVDGFVEMPGGCLSFGFMSTPGATAEELRVEAAAATLLHQPDLVVVLAPSNNLTAYRGLQGSAEDFKALIQTARSRWSNVSVFLCLHELLQLLLALTTSLITGLVVT